MRTSVSQLHAWARQHHQVSEAALAATFAEQQGERWRYNTDEGVWLQWVGTHWARRQTPELLDALRHFLVLFSKALCRVSIISNHEATKFQSQRAVSAVERLCRALPSFVARSALFDASGFQLGTPAGTIDLRTGAMTPPNPADHITVLTSVSPAKKGTRAPRWERFLNDITNGNKDFQKTLKQFAGISAEGTSRDQRIMFLYGSGGNGKGVYLRTIAGLLGEHAVNAPRDLLMVQRNAQHPTALVDVISARMAIATEVDDDATWDTALIKDLTGGDPMAARRMRQDFFRTTARCTLTIAGNRKPALKGIDEAVRRRFLVATFALKVAPDKVITDLEKQFIAEEGPAILRWIIDGAVERENEKRLFVAQTILDDTADYFAEENVLEDFINTFLERAEGKRVRTSDLYEDWKAYSRRFGRLSGARNTFTTAIRAAGIEYVRTMEGRYFLNVIRKSGAELSAAVE